MAPDNERIERMKSLVARDGFDALICCLPQNVLMLSGYLPVLAQSAAIFLPDGDGILIVPEGELPFALDGWFQDIRTYNPVTLDYVLNPLDALAPVLALVCCEKGIAAGVIGMEVGVTSVPSPYLEFCVHGSAPAKRWSQILPQADFRDATQLLDEAGAVKSAIEIERIRIACLMAERGFETARELTQAGAKEVEIASAAKLAMETEGTGLANVSRVAAWAFCMSGQRSAEAHLPYQHSTNRVLQEGDSVIVHIDCHAEGYWADVTRTFFVGTPSDDQMQAYSAVMQAWESAFRSVKEGVRAREVDSAARLALIEHGYTDAFKHGTGHGVGFRAIYDGDLPVIHPASDDVLDNDMVFSLRPAVYIGGQWGIRIGDVVSVRGEHGKVLSDMRRDIEWMVCSP